MTVVTLGDPYRAALPHGPGREVRTPSLGLEDRFATINNLPGWAGRFTLGLDQHAPASLEGLG